MKILMVTAEAVPFAKTGGLADMVSALAISLSNLGHDVRLVMPRYYNTNRDELTCLEGPLGVPAGYTEAWTGVYTTNMEGAKNLPIYFIDYEKCFGRDGIYGTPQESDFHDNPYRFSVLCHGAFQLCRKINWIPDVIHSHDWSTALVPVILKFLARQQDFSKTASIFTVHNLGYQGVYGKHNYPSTGLDWNFFYAAGFEDWDRMNFLKAGLTSADKITTVSPTYAKEIQSPSAGFRMDSLLHYRNQDLVGILNGVDTEVWNPQKDKLIASNFSKDNLKAKEKNKKALQERMGLPINPNVPIIGMISRLVDQKGVAELFAPTYGCLYKLCTELDVQIVILGSGERWCESELMALKEKLPNLSVYIGYNEELSHLIEAGSDFFLMPSRYEPCGLNQMYSMLYGTLPIVHRIGGLADTVQNYNETTGEGTGFMFDNLTPQSIFDTVGWAVYAWYNKKDHIKEMQKRAMSQNFTWDNAANQYVQVYKEALEKL